MAKPLSLEAFAAQAPQKHGPSCWVCQQPKRLEIDTALKGKVRPSIIARWLQEVEKAEGATLHKVKSHYYAGHHERKG